jgi:hypothetical protein
VTTGLQPFAGAKDGVIIYGIITGERPSRPPGANDWLSDDVWNFISRCWSPSRDGRPDVEFAINALNDAADVVETRRVKLYVENGQGKKAARRGGDEQVGRPNRHSQDEDNSPRVSGPIIGDNDNQALVQVLPPAPKDWFSRITDEILDLTDQAASVALFGPIGVGKSFVARTVLDHGRTKAKFGENRHFMCFDDFANSPDVFMEHLSDAIHIDATQLRSRLQSSPSLIFLLDGVDSALHPPTPEAEEMYAMIEEFGSFEHICLVTTSRMYPDIHGFHRIEVPRPPEDGARDIFYTLCNLGRSPAMDTLVATLDFHPLSIELLARVICENNWDEQMLLEAWDDQTGVLKTDYYQRLKDTIEPVLRSPRIQGLGTTARDVLEAIASFQSGLEERQLEGIFRGTCGIREVVDILCRFSLVDRQNGVLKMLSPLQFYFLKSMIVLAETEEVIRWGPDCMAAQGGMCSLNPFHGWRVTIL